MYQSQNMYGIATMLVVVAAYAAGWSSGRVTEARKHLRELDAYESRLANILARLNGEADANKQR